jgi:glutamine synthetase
MYRYEELNILIQRHVQQLYAIQFSMRRVKISVSEILKMLVEDSLMNGMLNFSGKEAALKFISENNVKILNICHIPEDGRLKTLSFSTSDKKRLREILEYGERVDGSSLFSFIEPGKSDIYVTPRIDKGFMNPFTILPTLNVLSDYIDENGRPLDVAPQNVLTRAEEKLQSSNGITMKALAELEFYVITQQQSAILFPGEPDKNYHESSPFAMFEDVRNEVLATLSVIGIPTKYGHSEVGRIITDSGTVMEQHEIEFMPQNLPAMAETVCVAKWVVRNICLRHGLTASFIPKIDLNHAGNGMHIHLCAFKDGRNIISKPDGKLSNEALTMIGGILKLAPSLTAFGNTTPVSYLRFIARKESPMHICWSAGNRLALIRIPLWLKSKKRSEKTEGYQETFEYRAPDAFANAHLLLAGLTLAANYGLDNAKESVRLAENLRAKDVREEEGRFKTLPRSCSEAADNLMRDRKIYEADGVFPPRLLETTIQKLNSYDDRDLWNELSNKPEESRNMLARYLHYG